MAAADEVLAAEPDGEEESSKWARQRAQELGLILVKSESGYKGVKKTTKGAVRQYTVEIKESMFVTKVLSGSFYSAEAAALAYALYDANK